MSVGGLDTELLYVIIPTLKFYFCNSVPHNCIMLSLHLVTFLLFGVTCRPFVFARGDSLAIMHSQKTSQEINLVNTLVDLAEQNVKSKSIA